jgi:hypothetical protein
MSMEVATVAEGYATLTSLAVRKVGPTDDRVLAVSLKLTDMPMTREQADVLLGAAPGTTARSFWDSAGEPRMLAVDYIQSTLEVMHNAVRIERMPIASDARIRQIRVSPKGPAFLASMKIEIDHPDSPIVAALAEYVGESVSVDITRVQGELDLDSGAA